MNHLHFFLKCLLLTDFYGELAVDCEGNAVNVGASERDSVMSDWKCGGKRLISVSCMWARKNSGGRRLSTASLPRRRYFRPKNPRTSKSIFDGSTSMNKSRRIHLHRPASYFIKSLKIEGFFFCFKEFHFFFRNLRY